MLEVKEESIESSINSIAKPKKIIYPFKNNSKDLTKNVINLNDSIDDPEYLEQQLALIYENLLLLYFKKLYTNILQEIDGKEEILFKDSIMSFNIYMIKIKTHIKYLKTRFNEFLSANNSIPNYFEIETLLITLNTDFKNIEYLLNSESDYEYEQFTENYCKYLLLLSLIKLKKEATLEAFCYINLGISLLKIFFIRKKMSNNIKIYYVYIRLLLLLINHIISDINHEQALLYIDLLFKIIEKCMKQFIKNNNININYQYKFIRIVGYAYLYSGYCFELKNDYISALESFKQAYYFLKKYAKFQIQVISNSSNEDKDIDEISKTINKINDIICFSKKLLDKVLYKLNQDKIEKMKKYSLSEKERQHLKNKKQKYNKEMILRLIASGLSTNVEKFNKFNFIQNRIYENILTQTNQALIEKLDNELISLVYKDRSRNKKQNIKSMSINTKKNLCHYEIYNSLMTKKFRGYITKNKNFQFNDPRQEKNSLDKIEGYLNNKIYQDSASENCNIKKSQKIILRRNINEVKNNKSKSNNNTNCNTNINTEKTLNTNENSIVDGDYFAKTFRPKSKSFQVFPFLNMNSTSSFTKRNSINFTAKNSINFTAKNSYTIPRKSKKIIKEKKNDSKNTVKIGFSKSYFKKYLFLDSLTCRELNFQKTLLNMKNKNSKLYFGDFNAELQNSGVVPKEEVYKKYLVLKDQANSKFVQYKMEDVIQLKNKKNDHKLIGNIFKTFSSKYSSGVAAKNAVHKVINRYIDENRSGNLVKPLYYVTTENVKLKNENHLLNLDNGINDINYLLQIKSEDMKKIK